MRCVVPVMSDHAKTIMKPQEVRDLTPQLQDAVLARRKLIAVAPLFLVQVKAAAQRFDPMCSPRPLYADCLIHHRHAMALAAPGVGGQAIPLGEVACRSGLRDAAAVQQGFTPSNQCQPPCSADARPTAQTLRTADGTEQRRKASSEADRLATAATERDALAREKQQRTQGFIDSLWQSLE